MRAGAWGIRGKSDHDRTGQRTLLVPLREMAVEPCVPQRSLKQQISLLGLRSPGSGLGMTRLVVTTE